MKVHHISLLFTRVDSSGLIAGLSFYSFFSMTAVVSPNIDSRSTPIVAAGIWPKLEELLLSIFC